MKVYVINLKQDVQRLAHMQDQLHRLGLEFERVDAIDGRTMEKAEFAQLVSERKGKVTPWMPGQMGCWLSHYKTWEKIAGDKAEYGLVLEDDMHLSARMIDFLSSKVWLSTDADVVRLEAPNNAVLLGCERGHGVWGSIRDLRSTAWCAGAYLLRKRTAERIIGWPPSTHMAVDAFLFSRELSGAARMFFVQQVTPALAIQDKYRERGIGLGSNIESIGQVGKDRISLAALARKVWRMLSGYRRIGFVE